MLVKPFSTSLFISFVTVDLAEGENSSKAIICMTNLRMAELKNYESLLNYYFLIFFFTKTSCNDVRFLNKILFKKCTMMQIKNFAQKL